MKKKMILTGIVLMIVCCLLVSSWITILSENYLVKWQHVTALLLFLPLPVLLFKNYKMAVLGSGVYLFLGLFRLLSLTAGISTGTIGKFGFEISVFNWLSLGLLILYFMLHVEILMDMQLDYKEARSKNKS